MKTLIAVLSIVCFSLAAKPKPLSKEKLDSLQAWHLRNVAMWAAHPELIKPFTYPAVIRDTIIITINRPTWPWSVNDTTITVKKGK